MNIDGNETNRCDDHAQAIMRLAKSNERQHIEILDKMDNLYAVVCGGIDNNGKPINPITSRVTSLERGAKTLIGACVTLFIAIATMIIKGLI